GGTGTFRIDAADVMYTAATIYTGSAVSSLTPVTTIAPGTFVAAGGTTYSIQVDGPGTGSFRLSWRDAPANDDLSRPAPIAGASGTWTGDNVGATKTDYEPAHGGDPGGASVWLTWTAPASGTLSLDTLGSDAQLDTLLAVYTQGFGQPLTLQAQDNDSGGGRKSALQLAVFEGTTYLIALDGF